MPLSKIVFAVRAKAGLTRSEALDHLANRHAPLVAASPTMRSRLKTYVQNRGIDAPGVPDQSSDRDWIIEGWRDARVVLPDPPTAADAIAVREDEARFPDRATLLAIAANHKTVLTGAPTASSFKIFSFYRQAPHIENWAERRAASAASLASNPEFRRWCRGIELNVAVPGEGQPARPDSGPSAPLEPAFDGIEVWRFDRIEDAAALFADRSALAMIEWHERLVDRAARFRFAAQEHVIFDDAGVSWGATYLAHRPLPQA